MGKIIVYTGPMFSQKTAFLLAEYDCSVVAQRTRIAFKPAIDGRFGKDVIKSRRGGTIDAICISDLSELLKYDVQDYFIDEFQFLTGDIQVLQKMAGSGKNFYISGLDMTAEGKPFAIMQELLCIADEVQKRKAVCNDCKARTATHSFFLGSKTSDVFVGDKEYIALCRVHWAQRMAEKEKE